MKESFSGSLEPREWSPKTAQDVLKKIQVIRAELSARGNVDAEPDILETVEGHLRQGLLTPQEASQQIDEMMASRYDR